MGIEINSYFEFENFYTSIFPFACFLLGLCYAPFGLFLYLHTEKKFNTVKHIWHNLTANRAEFDIICLTD